MARPLRIEYEGAWYHVMNRGTDRKLIFITDEHRIMFLETLKETISCYQIEVHAFCLMSNHYHLLIHTPHANLGRAMRHLNGIYTQRFNRMENRDGALYRGRYKAILIEEEVYLLQVSRYIHLNPVEAFLCSKPEEYPWSSYRYYFTKKNYLSWLTTETITAECNSIEKYIEYVSCGVDDDIKNFYTSPQSSTILATNNFINSIPFLSEKERESEEIIPDIKRTKTRPTIEIIMKEIALYFNVDPSELTITQHGEKNIPRLFSIYLSRQMGLYTHNQIGKFFNSKTYAISSALKRFKKKICQDKSLENTLLQLREMIYKKLITMNHVQI